MVSDCAFVLAEAARAYEAAVVERACEAAAVHVCDREAVVPYISA